MARKSRFNNPTPQAISVIPTANGNSQQQPPPEAPLAAESVIGPTSALTSFLREQGIRPRNLNPYARAVDQTSGDAQHAADTPSSGHTPLIGEETANGTGSRNSGLEDEPDSDDLDAYHSKSPMDIASSSKNKQLGGAVATATKKRNSYNYQDYLDSSRPSKKPGRLDNRPPGHITPCGECGRRFTVTRYTPNNIRGPGQLCDLCSKENLAVAGTGGQAKPTEARKKRAKRATRPQDNLVGAVLPSLQLSCINVIAEHISQIEALGDVGSVNLDRICKIVCKHRALLPQTLPLFLDAQHTELKIYDAVHLSTDDLASIPIFCPRLQRLAINYCGHFDGDVLAAFQQKLAELRSLELFGAYLVRTQHWQHLFEAWGTDHRGAQMQGFLLKQSPRFDLACVSGLASACPNLTTLRLADIGQLDDTALGLLHPLKCLVYLDISSAGIKDGITGESLTDSGVVALCEAVGAHLEHLDISNNVFLSDRTLLEGIKPNCPHLRSLNLSLLRQLLTTGVTALFTDWVNKGLRELHLERCIQVGNEALEAIIAHSGQSLEVLNLNSLDDLREQSLKALAQRAPELRSLDVSMVREVDDFILKAFMDGMPRLLAVRVYGDHRISELCPQRKGVKVIGQERAIIIG